MTGHLHRVRRNGMVPGIVDRRAVFRPLWLHSEVFCGFLSVFAKHLSRPSMIDDEDDMLGCLDVNDAHRKTMFNDLSDGDQVCDELELNFGLHLAETNFEKERHRMIGYHNGFELSNEDGAVDKIRQLGFENGYHDTYSFSHRIGYEIGINAASSILIDALAKMQPSRRNETQNGLVPQITRTKEANIKDEYNKVISTGLSGPDVPSSQENASMLTRMVRDFLLKETGSSEEPVKSETFQLNSAKASFQSFIDLLENQKEKKASSTESKVE